MLHARTITAAGPMNRFEVFLARHGDEVLEAQRLRWRVFAQEQGARLATPTVGVDIDRFDPHCEHLIVRDRVTETVVGTYRLLSAAASRATGGFYSEQEFDLMRLARLRPGMIEMGRSCVHPDYRGGAIIALLWAGLGDYIAAMDARTLIGCASISLSDGGHGAASIYANAARSHLSPRAQRVRPLLPLPLRGLDKTRDAPPPPLIKGYLRSGAMICGAPAFDPDFNTADLFMMLPLERLDLRYARHFQRPRPKAAA